METMPGSVPCSLAGPMREGPAADDLALLTSDRPLPDLRLEGVRTLGAGRPDVPRHEVGGASGAVAIRCREPSSRSAAPSVVNRTGTTIRPSPSGA